MPNTPPIQIDERLVTTAPTDAQATQADVLNYAEFLAQILEQHSIHSKIEMSTETVQFTHL